MIARQQHPASKTAVWDAFLEQSFDVVRRLPKPRVPCDSDRSVVMIEPRRHPHLEYVLRNVLYFLGNDWGLELFAGPANRTYIEELTASWGGVRIHPIDAVDLTTVEYNQLKKNPGTWRRIHAEYTLWVEPDCLLCRPGIEQYMSFHYIGAPWHKELAISPSCRVGNGGLSFRHKSAMLSIAERANRDHRVILSEDVFFCVNMQLCNIEHPGTYKLPTVEVAKSFAVESVFHPSPFGVHKIWKYLPVDRIRQLLEGIEY